MVPANGTIVHNNICRTKKRTVPLSVTRKRTSSVELRPATLSHDNYVNFHRICNHDGQGDNEHVPYGTTDDSVQVNKRKCGNRSCFTRSMEVPGVRKTLGSFTDTNSKFQVTKNVQ